MAINVEQIQQDVNKSLINTGLAREFTYIQAHGQTYDDTKGENVASESRTTIMGVISAFKKYLIDGDTIQIADKEVIFTADQLNGQPTAYDKIELAGDTFSVLPIEGDGAGVAWVVRARR